jgi:hypothetical protein
MGPGYTYVSSTHTLLPRGLNLVYDEWGGKRPRASCCTPSSCHLPEKSAEELERGQHYAASAEYKAYAEGLARINPDLWCRWSEKYINWRQLEILGLMSKGNWA